MAGTICREGTGDASGADLRSGREEADKSTRETIGYYDANAKSYVAETANVEFGELQREFARRLPRGGRVLDLGCGSGRDSLAFLKAGFEVDAVDGSAQMVEAASGLTGLPVAHALFEDFEPQGPITASGRATACSTCRRRSSPASSPSTSKACPQMALSYRLCAAAQPNANSRV